MFNNLLAAMGLIFILASSCVGVVAWKPYWAAANEVTLEAVEASVWLRLQSLVTMMPDQAMLLSLVGLLIGVLFMIPWWRLCTKTEGLAAIRDCARSKWPVKPERRR